MFKNKKLGLFDSEGKLILPATYSNIVWSDTGNFLGVRSLSKETNEYVNPKGEVAFALPADKEVSSFVSGRAIVKTPIRLFDDSIPSAGVIDERGTPIIPSGKFLMLERGSDGKGKPIYFSYTLIDSGKEDEEEEQTSLKVGIIDESGRELVPPIYDRFYGEYLPEQGYPSMKSDFLFAKKNEKIGAINLKGDVVLPFAYDEIPDPRAVSADFILAEGWSYFERGVQVVTQKNKVGLIDKQGRVIIPFRFDEIKGFRKGTSAADTWYQVTSGNKKGLFTGAGEKLAEPVWDSIELLTDGRIVATKGSKIGFFDQTGKKLTDAIYDSVPSLTAALSEKVDGGLYLMKKNGKFGYVTSSFQEAVKFEYDQALPYREGKAAVKKNGKWGFLGKDGKLALPLQWQEAQPFGEGLAPVKSNEKWGYIAPSGKLILSPQWDEAEPFHNGMARVRKGKVISFIDPKGKVLFGEGTLRTQLRKIEDYPDVLYMTALDSSGIGRVLTRSETYLFNKSGKLLTGEGYTTITPFEKGIALAFNGEGAYRRGREDEGKAVPFTSNFVDEYMDYSYRLAGPFIPEPFDSENGTFYLVNEKGEQLASVPQYIGEMWFEEIHAMKSHPQAVEWFAKVSAREPFISGKTGSYGVYRLKQVTK
ncbi:WG repeat-containing protein [Gorillibacterium sp. CAU 1737]|uniref:WG repeat-containing protein n=1 Tax=Gorillibacterium sp. CAU 1737 TaxID=3140362 RepID=UPI003261AA04